MSNNTFATQASCPGGNNAEGGSSASRQAQQTEPAVDQDGLGGSGVGAIIGLSAAAGEGGAGVASQVSQTRIEDGREMGDGVPTQSSAAGGSSEWSFLEKNLYNCDPNAYSFDNSNYFPRPQYENHLCNLCGNNSHDSYDCQQQFPFVHEQELSYNQNYDANHSVQNEESSNEIAVSNSKQEKEEPPQDSDIYQLIREECSTEICEEQKQSMEKTMLELVKICQEKEFLCIHDDIDDLIESALNSKLFLLNSNSRHLDKKEQEVKNDSKGDIRFLEALLIDDSILSHESSDSNFEDNPSIPRPPLEPPDAETNTGEEISVVMNNKDEDVYSSFIFVIFAKMFSLLSTGSEDTIFDP
nr:hypothetical protein [Tanacetum cinerariifolium]